MLAVGGMPDCNWAGLVVGRNKFITCIPTAYPSGRRHRKMRRAYDRWLIAELIEDLAPCPSSLRRVVVGHHAELGVFALQWGVDHVPGN